MGARSWSAGALGDTVLYRTRRHGSRLTVGYFVYWSEERPWGNNSLSYTVLPALAVDAVYSHFLYVFPGLKDAMYGAGDIEGVQVSYEQRPDGSLEVLTGRADDGNHGAVELSRGDLLDAKGRVVFLTDVWSHQLGAHGAATLADGEQLELKCYEKSSLRPMTESVAAQFRLGSEREPKRGTPAWLGPGMPETTPHPAQFADAEARSKRH